MNPEKTILMNRELIKACKENDTSLIIDLIDKGYDVSTYRNEPLRLAILNNNIPVVAKLLEKGVSPNSDGSQPYLSAIKLERLDIIKMFIQKEPPTLSTLSAFKQCQNTEIRQIINDSFKTQLAR